MGERYSHLSLTERRRIEEMFQASMVIPAELQLDSPAKIDPSANSHLSVNPPPLERTGPFHLLLLHIFSRCLPTMDGNEMFFPK
jgi:hypothetical protein